MDIRADRIIDSSPYYDGSAYQRLGVAPAERFTISQCADCGFAFSSQVPSDDFLEKLYVQSNEVEASVSVFARPERAAFTFRALSRLLAALSSRIFADDRGVVPQRLRILDVGCAFGVGSLGLACRYYPYEVTGIEWSKSARDYLSGQGMTVYRSLAEIPEKTSFDGILLNDILEHISDPVAFAKRIGELSHGGTAVWVNVPDFTDWRLSAIAEQVANGTGRIPTDLNPWEHLSYFSPGTLNALMGKAGFSRLHESPVEYRIKCDSSFDVVKATLRAMRDIWRAYQKRYPAEYSTAGIFVLADKG